LASEAPTSTAVPVALRRVVTGHDAAGSSHVVLQGMAPRTHAFRHIDGMVSRLVWATSAQPVLPFDGSDPTPEVEDFVPAPGETRFLVVTFPPDAVFGSLRFNPDAAQRENLAVSPGLAERFEPDGMHATPTVDCAVVLDGELWLELDEGRSTLLRQHDLIVQNGTRHAWRNKSDRPATVAFVLIGAIERHRTNTPTNTHTTP
jgi:hypothetical protein